MTPYEIVLRQQYIAGWSSLVARRAHNPKVAGSNPVPATTKTVFFCMRKAVFWFLTSPARTSPGPFERGLRASLEQIAFYHREPTLKGATHERGCLAKTCPSALQFSASRHVPLQKGSKHIFLQAIQRGKFHGESRSGPRI